jgi:hypothetical protein
MRRTALFLTAFAVVATTGCKSPEQKAAEDAAKNMAEVSRRLDSATKAGNVNIGDAMAAMGAAVGGAVGAANAGKKVETVDFHKLKDLLPESLPGMRRTEATGEKNAAMGMQISNAEGRYSNEQGASVTIKIADIGSMTGLAGMAAYAWAATSIDRETDTGYEKTATFNGYKSHEKYDKQSKSGELSVLVGNRFTVEANGNGIDMDALKAALSKVDLGKLDGMKGEGVQ